MIQLLIDNPLLLLFVVAAIGYPLGRVKVRGTSLGVAAVLFVGLAVGSLHPDLKLPEILYNLGLVLFVYTIGLSSGGLFFSSLRRRGLRDNLLVVGGVLAAAGLTVLASQVLRLSPTMGAGLFAGSLTNTPALAGILESFTASSPAVIFEQFRSEPVIAYSLTYPGGVIGTMLAISLLRRLAPSEPRQETAALRDLGASREPLVSRTVRISRPEAGGATVQQLIQAERWNVIFGRVLHDSRMTLANGQTRLQTGDLVTLIGSPADLDAAAARLGEAVPEHLEQDLSTYDKRRFFVSNPQVAGRPLRELHLIREYGAVVTRVRRGDIELLPHGDTVLALGDQVRVVARHEAMDGLASLFGDSYRAISEVDILTFSLGLALGILIGLVPIPLPNGLTLRLGLAGGPLIAALALGALSRTGPMLWTLPYSANLTLRQIGLVLFLAGVGTRTGYAFVSTLLQGNGLPILLAGLLLTLATTGLFLLVGYRLFHIPVPLLAGLLAGFQTQTAVLGYALEQTRSDLPNVGYATAYPIATITKIILAQILLAVL